MRRIRFAVLVGIAALTAGLAMAQGSIAWAWQADGHAQAAPTFRGPTRCADCHASPGALRPRDLALLTESQKFFSDAEAEDRAVGEGVRQVTRDKHALAYERLATDLGKQMGRLLGIADVAKDQRCLSCHANWRADLAKPPPFHEYGVSCESCHGPSSAWDTPHSESDWRKLSPAEKAALGMVDVRDPVKRAAQCFSCHIGDYAQGKVVTHAMYAAGHPPLPSIEIASFAEQMPPHWRHLPEKGNFEFRGEFIQANFPGLGHDPTHDLPRTKAAILGGVAALRQTVRLYADQASQGEESWPELAMFDCGSCHHDLTSPSWRQERPLRIGKPGRPPMHEWPTALVRIGIHQLSGGNRKVTDQQNARFEAQLDKLRTAFVERPFGNPRAIAAESKALEAALDALLARLSTTRFDRAAARRALEELCRLEASAYPDFHSARQTAWAAKVILAEWNAPYPTGFPANPESETRPQMRDRERRDIEIWEQWLRDVRQPALARTDEVFEQLQLNDRLFLNLPAGQEYEIDKALPASLGAAAQYDAKWFKRQLAELRRQIDLPIDADGR